MVTPGPCSSVRGGQGFHPWLCLPSFSVAVCWCEVSLHRKRWCWWHLLSGWFCKSETMSLKCLGHKQVDIYSISLGLFHLQLHSEFLVCFLFLCGFAGSFRVSGEAVFRANHRSVHNRLRGPLIPCFMLAVLLPGASIEGTKAFVPSPSVTACGPETVARLRQ